MSKFKRGKYSVTKLFMNQFVGTLVLLDNHKNIQLMWACIHTRTDTYTHTQEVILMLINDSGDYRHFIHSFFPSFWQEFTVLNVRTVLVL